jgi:hypothetical protein
MIGQATGGSTLLEVIMLIVQIATPAAVMLVAWMGKRIIAQNDEKLRLMGKRITDLESETRVTDKTAVVSDQIIRTELAQHYVAKTDHATCRAASRDTEIRVFEKIESMKTQIGEVVGEMRGLRSAVEGLTRGIGGLLRKD